MAQKANITKKRFRGRKGAAPLKLRTHTDETAVRWLFHRGPDSMWRWRKSAPARGVIAEGAHPFSSYERCVTDAKAHGYKQWAAPRKLKPISFSHVPRTQPQLGTNPQEPGRASKSGLEGSPRGSGSKKARPGALKIVTLRGNSTS